MNKAAVIAKIYRDLSEDPELLRACENVVSHFYSQKIENLRHITFASLGRAAGLKSAAEAVPIAEYLSSHRVRLLDKCYFLVVDDDEFEIPIEDVWLANAEHVLYHPETGEEVPEFEKSLYMYFTINQGIKDIIGDET